MDVLDTGSTAWILTCASLVLLMTPGLAFLYGGMSRTKSVLNMMMMSFSALAIVAITWIAVGNSMAGAGTSVGGLFGNPFDDFFLKSSMDVAGLDGGVPNALWAGFGATFAIITTALISGAVADRMKFAAWVTFATLWSILVYAPIAFWVWGGGILSDAGPIFNEDWYPYDFAGGTVVHINAGVAALVLALLLGVRKGFGKEPFKPHNLPFVMLGAALLWFGWFGFNAGSAGAADEAAGWTWLTTTAATAAAVIGWLVTEKIRDGKATSLGAASGVVAGLVAITPACAAVDAIGALIVGLLAGVLSALAVGLKYKFGYDDSLDVVGIHFVSGLWGTLAIGLLAVAGSPDAGDGNTGLFYGGGGALLGAQAIAAGIAIAYCAVATLIIGLVIKYTIGLRVTEEIELSGIDLAEHGETAYEEAK